jgi:hypothetical protein
MLNDQNKGLGGYQGGRSAPRAVLAKLIEKSRLRAALAAVQADLDAAIPALSPNELQDLQLLLAGEVQAADADAEALRQQVAEESALAQTTRAMQITIPRRASAILGAEAERRIARGVYPSAESLVGEAVAKAFAGARP